MNKKEINEIKSLFSSVDDTGVERMIGCYVDGEKNVISTFNTSFLGIDKEEMHKYLEIFRKSLSGTQGKNLIDMNFVLGSAGNQLLETVRKAELKDDTLNKLFFEQIISTYDCLGPYLILAIYQAYDVPGVNDDGLGMEDASEEVYSYVLTSICPIGVTKPGLGYIEDINEFHNLPQDKVVELPETAFLYPSFNGRSSDTSAILYYTQKGDGYEERMLEKFLGVEKPQRPAMEQKETFDDLLRECLGEDTDMEVVTSVQENMAEMVSDKKKNTMPGTPVTVGRDDVSQVLSMSGVAQDRVRGFEQRYDQEFAREGGSGEIYATNIMAPKPKLEMKTPDVVVKINYDKTSLVETRVIDGKRCLVIELGEGLVVNGVPVK